LNHDRIVDRKIACLPPSIRGENSAALGAPQRASTQGCDLQKGQDARFDDINDLCPPSYQSLLIITTYVISPYRLKNSTSFAGIPPAELGNGTLRILTTFVEAEVMQNTLTTNLRAPLPRLPMPGHASLPYRHPILNSVMPKPEETLDRPAAKVPTFAL
jgi:hypothetical protein